MGTAGPEDDVEDEPVGDVAVERIWPVNSPSLEKIEIKSHSKKKIRRAKLSYLRKSA